MAAVPVISFQISKRWCVSARSPMVFHTSSIGVAKPSTANNYMP